MSIGEEKYVSVTTYRKSGAAVSTPTWITTLDGGRVGFWTSSATGKAKRLRANPTITLQPSDARGRVQAGSQPVEGHAQLVTSGPDFDAIQARVRAKYGAMVPITRWLNRLGHIGKGPFPYGDVGVVVTLAGAADAS
jgi:PPOX class probable F420-dependent enzyme